MQIDFPILQIYSIYAHLHHYIIYIINHTTELYTHDCVPYDDMNR